MIDLGDDFEAICAAVHEIMAAYAFAGGEEVYRTWEEAPEWQKDSTRAGVEWRIENPEAPFSAQHDRWMADKLADGWNYGVLKNPEQKLHPCILPWRELSTYQRVKDMLFVKAVQGLVDKLSFQV